MPHGLGDSAMASSPNGGGVILFGGDYYNSYGDNTLFKLDYGSNNWTVLPQKLKYPRGGHVVIPIP